ncbi:MAG: OmpA family protein [Bdellovibrionota bacterium]
MEQPSAQAQLSTTLVSMTIILLTMFLYLNSIAKPDPARKSKVLTSISQIFAPRAKRASDQERRNAELLKAVSSKLQTLLVPIKGVQVASTGSSILVSLRSDSVFARGDSQLNPDGTGLLHRFAESLKTQPVEVEIEAHTDNVVDPTSRFQSPWALTMEQASAMFRLLRGYEFPLAHLSAAGFGDVHAVASNETPEGREKNRRIVLRLRPVAEADTASQNPVGSSGSNQKDRSNAVR